MPQERATFAVSLRKAISLMIAGSLLLPGPLWAEGVRQAMAVQAQYSGARDEFLREALNARAAAEMPRHSSLSDNAVTRWVMRRMSRREFLQRGEGRRLLQKFSPRHPAHDPTCDGVIAQ